MTEEYLNMVCKVGQGEKTCRYVALSRKGFFCAKTDFSLRQTVDARADSMTAKGDNCIIDPDFLEEVKNN